MNIISFVLGIALVAYCRTVPAVSFCVITVICFICSWRIFPPRHWSRTIGLNLIFLGLGFLRMDWQAQQWLMKKITPQQVGHEVTISGTVASLPVEEIRYTRFLFNTETLHLQLSWPNPHPPIHVGEYWQITVRLKPPHALANFGAFNRQRFLWTQDIHGTGYVTSNLSNQRLAAAPWYWISHWRERLQQEIRQTVHDPTAAAIISALTIGVESGLTDADWRILQRTGTVHLVVIAGLHIGFLVLIAGYCGSWLWRCWPQLLMRWPAQRAAALTALIFALCYGALAGFGIPTQRAVIMTVILALSELCDREVAVSRRILAAGLAVLIIQPGAVFSAGFWLSFAAVAWIAYSMNDEWRRRAHWRQWLRMQWALWLGLTPLTIYFFQQFSLVSMLANLPAIVWIGWVIVPLCLLAAIASVVNMTAGIALFNFAAHLLLPLWHFLQWLAAWPAAGWQHAFANQWMLLPALLGAAWYLAPAFIPLRWLGLLGLLPIWLIHPSRPPPGAYWVTMLDVGQGLAITVQTAHHLLVYDTGEHIPDGFDAGRDIVAPYLVTLGAEQIDMLMVSHGDNDHSGGAAALLSQWPVRKFLTSIPSMFRGHNPQYCAAGQQWQWDGVPFRVLWPPADSVYQDNDSSCVLQVGAPGRRLLLTGDIEAATENALIAQYGRDLSAQILSVPHHGSKTSSTIDFLQNVHPCYALFSLGYFNRFHFPAPSVVQRYQILNSQQWQTAQSGAILLHVPAQGPLEMTTVNHQHYFWQSAP